MPASKLVRFDLGRNSIWTVRAVKAIEAASPMSKLMSLNLDLNKIDSDGVKAIAAALQKSKLTFLSLLGNYISADGRIAIKGLLSTSTLTTLLLSRKSTGVNGFNDIVGASIGSQFYSFRLHPPPGLP